MRLKINIDKGPAAIVSDLLNANELNAVIAYLIQGSVSDWSQRPWAWLAEEDEEEQKLNNLNNGKQE